MFGRRNPRSRSERVLSWLWPRRGLGPAARYLLKRLVRLKGSPHAIAVEFHARGQCFQLSRFQLAEDAYRVLSLYVRGLL